MPFEAKLDESNRWVFLSRDVRREYLNVSKMIRKLEKVMGPKEFAIRTGKPEKTISAILKGESSITADSESINELSNDELETYDYICTTERLLRRFLDLDLITMIGSGKNTKYKANK